MTSVLIASDGWNAPLTAMHRYSRDVLTAVRSAGVDAIAGPLANYSDGRRIGGTIEPVLRCLLTRYDNPEGRVVHHTGWPPNGRRGAAVVSLFDLFPFRDPDPAAFLRRTAFRAMARRARWLIANCASIGREIPEKMGRGLAERTTVVPIPISTPPSPPNEPKDNDVLWIGVDKARKGLGFFLEESRRFPELSVIVRWSQIRRSGPAPDVARALPNSARENLHHIMGRLSDADLERLYARSRCIVSTSTYEGFHMPIMEAYLRGVRVVVPALEPYLGMYGEAEGVHYYARSPGTGPGLTDAVREAVRAPSFRPSERIREWVSFRSVGETLKGLYESADRR